MKQSMNDPAVALPLLSLLQAEKKTYYSSFSSKSQQLFVVMTNMAINEMVFLQNTECMCALQVKMDFYSAECSSYYHINSRF